MTTPAALHSSKSDRWYTPVDILDRARVVLDGIDLDPASDDYGNARVRADRFYGSQPPSLQQDWSATSIFLNPPSGKIGRGSKPVLFWRRLIEHLDAGVVGHAIFVAFSIEQMQTTQDGKGRSIAEFPFCVPKRRLAFDKEGETKTSPAHSNVIVYCKGQIDRTKTFVKAFADLGVLVGCRT